MLRLIKTNIVNNKFQLFKHQDIRAFWAYLNSRNISFLSGTNATYIEELYDCWKKDPNCVHKSWDLYFRASDKGLSPSLYYQAPPAQFFGNPSLNIQSSSHPVMASDASSSLQSVIDENLAVYSLIRNYQILGHRMAKLDPLEFQKELTEISTPPELTLSHWNLNESHLDKVFILPKSTFIGGDRYQMTLREIISSLKKIYTSNIGIECSHLEDRVKVDWITKKFEHPSVQFISKEDKIILFKRIVRATLFEEFLAKKFPSEKRFGLEGCEALIPCLKDILDQSSGIGVESFVLGMAHRGRLNVLANVCGQPVEHILARFNDELGIKDKCSGDVKYHLGLSRIQKNDKTGKDINIAVVANPSHLEAVNPVVEGKTKAEQFIKEDNEGNKVMSILIHGDAAFSGQGVVYETLHLSELLNYTVHGTIHVVTNNQIGFTTDPRFSRSSRYCTDVAKVINAPIFHVNADNPEAVTYVSKIASEYRNKFKKDVVIDLVSYRRNGHNEGDNPSFTQPLITKKISEKQNVLEVYSKKLVEEGVMTSTEMQNYRDSYRQKLNEDFNAAQKCTAVDNKIWIDSPWKNFFKDKTTFERKPTGVSKDELIKYQKLCCKLPSTFNINPGVKRVLAQRLEMLSFNKIDWAMGEIAAFSSLLSSGIHVRLSGQDVERGTFSHRHHVLHDYKIDDIKYVPLNNVSHDQAKYVISNSSLSEYGVLGYEMGYSMASPHILSIWEGQFGDFSNTAQCIIDQFISSGEDKWTRQSGLVLLLPHGYDGQGPEHSSARLERFLQLSKDDPDVLPPYSPENYEVEQIFNNNWIVANLTTPGNLFHALRRQLSFDFRKPLLIMSPKSLLRHEMARSSLDEMDEGTHFRRVIEEEGPASKNAYNVKRLIFCSGKVYYDLVKLRNQLGFDNDFAITRIEQISPFPFDLVSKEIEKYPNASLMFTQEEPKNQGAWNYVYPRINLSCKESKIVKYSGRDSSVSPATGSKLQNNIEQKALLNNSFLLE